MRVTPEQARLLLGLEEPATRWVLRCLAREGFLDETPSGEFVLRTAPP
jgi:hypothetical protein